MHDQRSTRGRLGAQAGRVGHPVVGVHHVEALRAGQLAHGLGVAVHLGEEVRSVRVAPAVDRLVLRRGLRGVRGLGGKALAHRGEAPGVARGGEVRSQGARDGQDLEAAPRGFAGGRVAREAARLLQVAAARPQPAHGQRVGRDELRAGRGLLAAQGRQDHGHVRAELGQPARQPLARRAEAAGELRGELPAEHQGPHGRPCSTRCRERSSSAVFHAWANVPPAA